MTAEPCGEKICLWGFRPGQTQTRLHSNRDKLEISDFETREIILSSQQKIKALISLCGREADLRLCFSCNQK